MEDEVEARNRESHQTSVFLHPNAKSDPYSKEVPNGTRLKLTGQSVDGHSYHVQHPTDGQIYSVKKYHVIAVTPSDSVPVLGSCVTLRNREAQHAEVVLFRKDLPNGVKMPNGTRVTVKGEQEYPDKGLCLIVEHEGLEYVVKKYHTMSTGPADLQPPLMRVDSGTPCPQRCGRVTSAGYASCCRTCEANAGRAHGPGCDEKWGAQPGAVGASSASTQVYMSCQHTANAVTQTISFAGVTGDIKVSMPTFNKTKPGATSPAPLRMIEYDVPVFGPRLTRAVMALFEGPTMQEEARKLNITIPTPRINQVVQSKMVNVRVLINELRAQRKDEAAVRKLEGFVQAVETLQPPHIKNHEDWTNFIQKHSSSGWENNLHVDIILTNFGFASDLGRQLKTREDMNRALRWLSKAFEAYGIQGSLCDVVNLVYAMLQRPPGRPGPAEVVQAVEEINVKLTSMDFASMWVPTHLVMDCEVDDVLAWLLLSCVHTQRRSRLNTLAQLPIAAEFNVIEQKLQAVSVKVFRDHESANADAVKLFWLSSL